MTNPFGPEARAFAQGAFAAATEIELLRSPTLDPYGRTLAYLFINGRNYSVMVIKARFSGETVSHYGDNGLPKEAAEIMAAAKEAGASLLPFEPPHLYRARMRTLDERTETERAISEQLKQRKAIGGRTCRSSGSRVNVFGWSPRPYAPPRKRLGLAQRPRDHGDAQAQPGRHSAPGRTVLRADRDQARDRSRLGDHRRGRAAISASSACTGSTGEIAGRPAVC